MTRIGKALALAGIFATIGHAACEDDEVLEIETPDGEIEVEEDGDVNVDN